MELAVKRILMIFNSYIFIFIFLPITWLTFHYCRTKFGIGVSFKVLSVSFFIYYAWWNPPFIFLPLASVVFNFFGARKSLFLKIQNSG